MQRLQNTLGLLGALQGLQGQRTEQDLAREKLSQMQQNGPMESQLLQQKLQEMMFQNSPENQQLQGDIGRAQVQRVQGGGFGDILQALSYSGDLPAIRQLLMSKGMLPANFGQAQLSPQDEQLKQNLQQMMQQRGMNSTK